MLSVASCERFHPNIKPFHPRAVYLEPAQKPEHRQGEGLATLEQKQQYPLSIHSTAGRDNILTSPFSMEVEGNKPRSALEVDHGAWQL